MALTGQKTKYYIARTNAEKEEDSILRFNNFNGMFSVVTDFDQATEYASFEESYQLVQMHNQMAQFMNQPYEYYVVQYDVNSFRLDSEGNKVEEIEEFQGE